MDQVQSGVMFLDQREDGLVNAFDHGRMRGHSIFPHQDHLMPHSPPPLIDRFGRTVNYVRLSITDRCDFRCVYCMSEKMVFLPRSEILSLEEIMALAEAFVALGVSKIRVTGGEPLVRKGALGLLRDMGRLKGLRELVITTNGAQLQETAKDLKAAGINRINISLDSLRPERFREMTRVGDLATVLKGIEAARAIGFDGIKLNSVILRERNQDEVVDLVHYAIARDIDISFIEEMPLGILDGRDRALDFVSSDEIRAQLSPFIELLASTETTGGPSKYYRVLGSKTRVGFISPHSHNFCSSCNRVRVTAEGRLLLCLGNEHAVDLKPWLRQNPFDPKALQAAIREAMDLKPLQHEFDLKAQPVIFRHMNATGG